mmetsp:Transcript_72267/g.211770  ORF Transcript_72267/g.211770 Transcript_72267/m.211770 type:complete len:236 (+) Transcript_72267:996-1703(+)
MNVDLRDPGRGREEVPGALVVDLQDGDLHLPGGPAGERREDGGDRAGRHALRLAAPGADHRVRLAGARLAVGDDGAVVAADDGLGDRRHGLRVHVLLRRLRAEGVVAAVQRLARVVAAHPGHSAAGPQAHAVGRLDGGAGVAVGPWPQPDAERHLGLASLGLAVARQGAAARGALGERAGPPAHTAAGASWRAPGGGGRVPGLRQPRRRGGLQRPLGRARGRGGGADAAGLCEPP